MISVKPSRCIIDTCRGNSSLDSKIVLSIVIPTYKRFELLKETIRSVYANEFSFSVEVIIVDNDPENDELAQAAMHEFLDKPLKYYKNETNYGMFGNWNQCLTLARGEYITILHDDDLLNNNFSHCVERELKLGNSIFGFSWHILDQREEKLKPNDNILHGIIKSTVNFFRRKDKPRYLNIHDFFVMNQFIGTLGVVFEREKGLLINGFDENNYPVSDFDFWIRWLITFGKIKFSPDKVSYYRIRANESMKQDVINMFIDKNDELRGYLINEKYVSAHGDFRKILKLRDKMLFNFNWNGRQNYKKNTYDVFLYVLIRCYCYIMQKSVRTNKSKN